MEPTYITPHLDTEPKEIRYTVKVNGHTWHIIDGVGQDADGNVNGYEILLDGMVKHFCHRCTLDQAIIFCNERATAFTR